MANPTTKRSGGVQVREPQGAGANSRRWVERDAAALSPSYTRSYPFVIERGRGSEVWDVDGHRYIDMNAGIAVTSTGHCHPEVVKAKWESMDKVDCLFGTGIFSGDQTYGIKHHAVGHPLPYQKLVNGKVVYGGWIDVGAIP